MNTLPRNKLRLNQDEPSVPGESLPVTALFTVPSRPLGHKALGEVQVTASTSGGYLHIPAITIPLEPSR